MIDNAATEQKKQNGLKDLVDDVLDENNPFNDEIKTEVIILKAICLMIMTKRT